MSIANAKHEKTKNKNKNKFLLTFICVFAAIIIVFGIVFGIIAAVGQSSKIARYGSQGVDLGEASYLASYYKYQHIRTLRTSGIQVSDSPAFWASDWKEGKTHGEFLRQSFEEFLEGILISAELFERNLTLADNDKEKIAKIAESPIVRYKNEAGFNKVSEKYGFDYNDYKNCISLMYKAAAFRSYILGVDGSKLTEKDTLDFLDTYSHVALLFLSDKDLTYKNSDGEYESRPLTEEELAEREAINKRLTDLIEGNADGQSITPETIEYYYPKSDSDQDMLASGYHLRYGSQSTEAFSNNYPEVVQKAIEMGRGEYAKVKCKIGTCFIYKYTEEESKKKTKIDPEGNPFFSDFYQDAADYVFAKVLDPLSGDVVFTDGYSEMKLEQIPMNYELIFSVN